MKSIEELKVDLENYEREYKEVEAEISQLNSKRNDFEKKVEKIFGTSNLEELKIIKKELEQKLETF
jgi:predicted  nucleic acid-binding Zn-ribbon protein